MKSGSRQLAPIIWKPRHDWEEAEEMSISWECGQFELPSRSPRRVAGMSLEMRSINSRTCLSSSQKLPGFKLRSYLIVCFHPTAFIIHKDRDHISLVPCCICSASYIFAKWGVYEYTHTHTSNEISLLEACTLCISPQKSSERRVWWDLMQACDLTALLVRTQPSCLYDYRHSCLPVLFSPCSLEPELWPGYGWIQT